MKGALSKNFQSDILNSGKSYLTLEALPDFFYQNRVITHPTFTMSKLQPIQIDDNTVIYIEATDHLDAPTIVVESEETTRTAKGIPSFSPRDQAVQSFQIIESTIKTYTQHTLNAFKDAALTEVQKVTLEFGVNVSGMGGIPYIASGTAGCNIKITVECVFKDSKTVEKSV